MSYDITAFRTTKHGLSDVNAYCRQCGWISNDTNTREKARNHAKKTLHTVDVYRETWTEYTSYVKGSTKKES